MAKITKKQRILDALKDLPEDTTFEDATERLLFMVEVEEGRRDARAGHLIPHDETKKQSEV